MLAGTIVALIAAAGAASAAVDNAYRLRVLHAGSDFHHGLVSASQGTLRVDGPAQKVHCTNDKKPEAATFLLNGIEVWLYTGEGTPNAQQIFTDRSGMGRGLVGYLNDASPIPEEWQTRGFHVGPKGNLKLEDDNFWACPSADGIGYVLGLQKVRKQCVQVKVQPEHVEHPVACQYQGGM